MNCADVKAKLLDWLNDKGSAAERAALDTHLAQCSDCQQELAKSRQVWQLLGAAPTPEPRPEMRAQFYAMLETFEATEPTTSQQSWLGKLEQLTQRWTPGFVPRLAYSLLLLGLGVTTGYWLQRQQSSDITYQNRIDTLSGQVQQMRQVTMLSLLENPSATQRLRAVGYTKDISGVDDRVVDALLMTLNNDSNVNVRLVTLEALAGLAHDARVREALVQSLTRQESPLVQVALADVMVKLQEKRSLKPLRQLLRQEGINDLVRTKIEQTIKDLS